MDSWQWTRDEHRFGARSPHKSKLGIAVLVLGVAFVGYMVVRYEVTHHRASVEANRMLRLIVMPPHSKRLSKAPSALSLGPGGHVAASDWLYVSQFWDVGIPARATMDWFSRHQPSGMWEGGEGHGGGDPNTVSWFRSFVDTQHGFVVNPQVDIEIVPNGPHRAWVELDGVVVIGGVQHSGGPVGIPSK